MRRLLVLVFFLLIGVFTVFWLRNRLVPPIGEPRLQPMNSPLESPKKVLKKSSQPIVSHDPVVVAAGDIACHQVRQNDPFCQQKETAGLISEIKPQAVLTLGDLQYDRGEYRNFLKFYETSWGTFKAITRPAPGNHEYATPDAAGYFDYFDGSGKSEGRAGRRDQGYYSFDLGAWHLISLNSNCWKVSCKKNSAQLTWLRRDLQAHPNFCTLAYWHHPRFSSGYHGNNYFLQPLWQILYENGVDLALSGHDHDYERFAPQNPQGELDGKGIRQFVVGTGGKSIYGLLDLRQNSQAHNGDSFGVLKLTLHEKGYDWEFVTTRGNFQDFGGGHCH